MVSRREFSDMDGLLVRVKGAKNGTRIYVEDLKKIEGPLAL